MALPSFDELKKAHRERQDADRVRAVLGRLLVDAGKISDEDIERILALAKEKGIQFGEAAVKLRLVKKEDIEAALAKQYGHTYLRKGERALSKELIAIYRPESPKVKTLRALRVQLMLGSFKTTNNALAMVSSGAGEGRSFLVANLAVVFAQLGQRTVLVDAHMQKPRLHEMFAADNSLGLSAALVGRTNDVAVPVAQIENLWLVPAGASPPNPDELLARNNFARFCAELISKHDVVLFDTAPGSSSTCADSVADRCGKAIIVVRRDQTTFADAKAFAERMRNRAKVVGSILNRH